MTFKLPHYILQELPDISETIKFPIINVHRIKYTCFDVSKSFIAFGATSGGIYIFNRNPIEFIQLIPSKDGLITRLCISTDEKHIGFANGKGTVTVTGCDQSLSGGYSTTTSKEHNGNEVTAMAWGGGMLFSGDDVGRVSVLQLHSFIAKAMFHGLSQIILSLDSRICQLDTKGYMLLVSTLTRCYICNTIQEQYIQVGHRPRDGEFGACFVTKEKLLPNGNIEINQQNVTELKKYNIVDKHATFSVGNECSNTLIYCARPSSRLWEATADGLIRRTHQFKQVLGKPPMNIITLQFYENESLQIGCIDDIENGAGQSINFSKIYFIGNAIFSFSKNALYFLNVEDADQTLWFETYKDIVDCKIYHDMLYVWLGNGSLVHLKFMKIEKLLVKCYLDEKYLLCAKMCALYSDHLLSNYLSSAKLHMLVGLRDKLQNDELLDRIKSLLEYFEHLEENEATQMESGIYVVDNTYHEENIDTKNYEDSVFSTISPDTLQTLKEIRTTVSDKLSSSKKIIMETWEDIEEKMKYLGTEKQPERLQDKQIEETVTVAQRISKDEQMIYDEREFSLDRDIIFKESSQKTKESDNNVLDVCKSLYQYFRLSLVSKESDQSNLNSIIENFTCDISSIHNLILSLEQYCESIGAVEESKYVPNNIFLLYLKNSTNKSDLIDAIIVDEVLYKYFVDSCISVNLKTQKLLNLGCECGFPLPYTQIVERPVFSDLIDEFLEKQWACQTREQCYDICKQMPYLWRKILFLRRNEDLMNILRILLQILDEHLLHSFLPQFTLDTWDRAIQLYATLYANICLNCNNKFEHVSVKDMMSWDDLGLLIIKSIGGKNAVELMRRHANLIEKGAITIKFYHTCLLASLYEKYDGSLTAQLVDSIYGTYEFEDSRLEICQLLKRTVNGELNNTALPLTVAVKSAYWGLQPLYEELLSEQRNSEGRELNDLNLTDILKIMSGDHGVNDCDLCGLPLQNEVLIKDGGLWAFKCGHIFHGACLELNKIKLCPSCTV